MAAEQRGKSVFTARLLKSAGRLFDRKNKPWKYKSLADEIMKIHTEDEYNDCYGRKRMYIALMQKKDAGEINIAIPCECTVRKVMEETNLIHKPKRKPNGITKEEREAMKSENLLKRDFKASKPCEKHVTDITEIKAKDGKLYVSAIFDCFDVTVLSIAMDTNMKAALCVETVKNAVRAYSDLKGAILHSDRGSQYTGEKYRQELKITGLIQSMNSAGGDVLQHREKV